MFKFRDEKEPKRKFAWLPVCINDEKHVWVWLEYYTEKVICRYGIGGVQYHRECKGVSGTPSGFVG